MKFNELQNHLREKDKNIASMSCYFSTGVSCDIDVNGYYKLECISSGCDNSECQLKPFFTNEDFDITDIVYDQLIQEKCNYRNKKGEKKELLESHLGKHLLSLKLILKLMVHCIYSIGMNVRMIISTCHKF